MDNGDFRLASLAAKSSPFPLSIGQFHHRNSSQRKIPYHRIGYRIVEQDDSTFPRAALDQEAWRKQRHGGKISFEATCVCCFFLSPCPIVCLCYPHPIQSTRKVDPRIGFLTTVARLSTQHNGCPKSNAPAWRSYTTLATHCSGCYSGGTSGASSNATGDGRCGIKLQHY